MTELLVGNNVPSLHLEDNCQSQCRVEIVRLYHVPVCVGEIGDMSVVGYWPWGALAVELTEKLSDEW